MNQNKLAQMKSINKNIVFILFMILKYRLICLVIFIVISNNLWAQIDSAYYRGYNILDSMLTEKKAMDLKEAIFTVENAYFDEGLSFEHFDSRLNEFVAFVKTLSSDKLISYNHADFHSVNVHAAIFQMMTDTIPVLAPDNTLLYHLPFQYNFDDYASKKEWSNMFVSTLMDTRTGNCHSLPLFYKLLTEELGEKSWLALAPNHSYIKLHNQADGWYNVELTSGQFPTDIWIKASGYIHTDAIRQGIYMDTLSRKNTVALCMTDLAEGYKHKHISDYDPEFVLMCCNRTLVAFPDYVNALLLKAETLLDIFKKTGRKEYYQEVEKLYSYIHKIGYRKMPEKMYLEWLQSLSRNRKNSNKKGLNRNGN